MEDAKKITTIKIEKETKTRLDRLKEHERETYNQVIKKILHILNLVRRDPALGNRMLGNIDITIKRMGTYNKANKLSKTSESSESPQ